MIRVIFLLSFFFRSVFTGDPDCYKVTDPTEEKCTNVKTNTLNICCYTNYTNTSDSEVKECITIDGSNPQTVLISRDKMVSSMEGEGKKNVKIVCKTEAEKCEAISEPSSFDDCNKQSSAILNPFNCCFIKLQDSQYCYPVNARYQQTVNNYAEMLQEDLGIDYLPEITCSTDPLPEQTSGSYTKIILANVILLFSLF